MAEEKITDISVKIRNKCGFGDANIEIKWTVNLYTNRSISIEIYCDTKQINISASGNISKEISTVLAEQIIYSQKIANGEIQLG